MRDISILGTSELSKKPLRGFYPSVGSPDRSYGAIRASRAYGNRFKAPLWKGVSFLQINFFVKLTQTEESSEDSQNSLPKMSYFAWQVAQNLLYYNKIRKDLILHERK